MRDTSILSGKWGWVWQVANYPGGASQIILDAIAEGFRGVLVKAGDGANAWAQFAQMVKPCRDAGLAIGAWTYCYGDNPQGEAKVAIQALDNGADLLVLDIEMEYAGKAQSAVTMGQALRAKYPTALIAFSPYCFVQNPNFPGYPWSPKWGQIPYSSIVPWIDAVLPQVYWSDWPPTVDVGLKTMDPMIRPWGKPIYPIGQAYADSYTPAAEDYKLFETTCKSLGYTGVSFWRMGTMTDVMKKSIALMNFPELQMSKEDADKMISLLGSIWNMVPSEESKDEVHRLANVLRKTSGQQPT